MAASKILLTCIVIVAFVSVLAFSISPAIDHVNLREERKAPAVSTSGTFAYISEFTSGGTYSDYGWNLISGHASITNHVQYFGEPSLVLSNGASLITSENITPGDQFVSFQFAVNAVSGTGTFAIINSMGNNIASVSVSGSTVTVTSSQNKISATGSAPQNSAYPDGWVYVSGNLYNTSTNKQFSWTLQLFVDQTISVFANLNDPLGYSYAGLQLSASSGHAYFTDIIFTTYDIPTYLAGYNNMEGYGQGSGLLVSLLHPFTILHANMILNSWNTLQNGILSFQINAMNYTGTLRSTCVGFFQLGIDLDPNGTISPWYVEGTNCVAHYFLNSNNPAVQPGFKTPIGTELGLTIQDITSAKEITFQIIDFSVSGQDRYWNATIPYSGSEFYGTYTQLEFQPVAEPQILDYHFSGSIYNMTYGSAISSMIPLNNSYMLPFTLDAPSTWSLTYYNGQQAGYQQIA